MRIGIDISQIVHGETGVGNYVRNLVKKLVETDTDNTYILFGSSLRRAHIFTDFYGSLNCDPSRVILKTWFVPPTLLDIVWNSLHIIPVEWIIGNVDVFWSSDWTQPPLARARGVTTIHDVSFIHYPESFHKTIRSVQKRRLKRAKEECDVFLCDSEATKKDVVHFLHIDQTHARVVYPGFTQQTI